MTMITSRFMRVASLLAVTLLGLSLGCNRYDSSQVPTVTVGKGLRPQYSWTPSPAYLLQVYEGAEDKDGLGVLWSVTGSGGYENKLASPVAHGVPPAGSEYVGGPPLQAGKTYTVTVTRMDEQGSGDGFTNTRHKYVGKATFVATE